WIEAVQDDRELDPQFKSLLKHHWMEEAQHAKLDTLIVDSLSHSLDSSAIESAINEYLEIGGMVDGGLGPQVGLDIGNRARATGRRHSSVARDSFAAVQRQAMWWTYLGSGMTHPKFAGALGELAPAAADRVAKIAQTLS